MNKAISVFAMLIAIALIPAFAVQALGLLTGVLIGFIGNSLVMVIGGTVMYNLDGSEKTE